MTNDTEAGLSEATHVPDRSGHTSARMSTPPRRIEVITGPERRRRWSREQKQAIVEESLSPHATPAAIARKHGIGTGQLYTWRRQLLRKDCPRAPPTHVPTPCPHNDSGRAGSAARAAIHPCGRATPT